jgi:molybdate-binding protein
MSIIQIGMDTDKVERDITRAYMQKLTDKIAGLKRELGEAREICDAVAHVGVDFGYGVYTLEDSIIHRARLLLEELKEKGNE